MIALTIHQPWAWAIIHAGKDIENRVWPSAFFGRVLVHAGKGGTKREFGDACLFMTDLGIDVPFDDLEAMPRGVVIGAVTITGCVERSRSPWFVGPYGFELQNPKAAPELVPCKGQERFWHVPDDVAERLRKGVSP